jgi:antitoxin HicB
MLAYPAKFKKDTNGTILVTFPDIPEAISAGMNVRDARAQALDALEAAFEIYFDQRRTIPMPSKIKRSYEAISLPALVTAKVFLANEMVAQNVRKAELARRLKVHTPQVDRLLNLKHSSKIELVECALGALGRQLSVQLV